MKPMGGRTWKYWPASGRVFFVCVGNIDDRMNAFEHGRPRARSGHFYSLANMSRNKKYSLDLNVTRLWISSVHLTLLSFMVFSHDEAAFIALNLLKENNK